jgi:uncharacterized membrane-anchored protein
MTTQAERKTTTPQRELLDRLLYLACELEIDEAEARDAASDRWDREPRKLLAFVKRHHLVPGYLDWLVRGDLGPMLRTIRSLNRKLDHAQA